MKKRLLLFLVMSTFTALQIWAQKTVTGSVASDEGEPLIGVNIMEAGTSNGTITDIDGNYSITVPDGASLEFSIIGYEPQTIEIGNQSVIDLTMTEGVQLSEVVVTALGIEREKKALGYSVTEVEGEEFTAAREINIGNALAGKVAGVNVSNVASGPGGSTRVVIRGNSSLSGNNQPLYVVDGIPIDNQNLGSAGMWGGSDWGDGISSVNPDDIEKMTVLKGNTAAALYGSRASNGVILITTKNGTKRKGVGVEFSTNYTFENFIDNYDFQQQYGQGNRGLKPSSSDEAFDQNFTSWGEKLDGSSVPQWDGEQRPYSYAGNNLKKFYDTGSTWTNSLSLTGGNDQFNFRMGVTNLQNKGIVPNSGLDRNTFTTKVSGTFGRLTATISGSYINEDVFNRPRLSDSPGNANFSVAVLAPNVDVETMLGPNGNGSEESGAELRMNPSTFSQNPYWAAYRFENNNVRNRLMGNFRLRYDFTDWLYLQGRIGMDTYTDRRRALTPYGTAFSPEGGLNETQRNFKEINMDFILGVDKRFGAFGLNAFVGGNQMDNRFETLGGSGGQFAIPFLETINNLKNQNVVYGISEKAINSVFGSVELSYNNYLYLTATARNDWFSTLTKANNEDSNNSILYPSVGLSFVFTDAFDMSTDIISFGKVRASWAQVGGDTDPYQLALTYGLVGQGHMGNPLGRIAQGQIPNADLVPLTNTEFEIGVDMRFFKNRLGFDFAYYNRKTEDDILVAGISQTSGFGSKVVNIGQMQNNGVELLLYGTPVKNQNWQWDVSLNFAHNNNEVVSLLDPDNDDLKGTDEAESVRVGEARSRQAYIHHIEGFPYSSIMGFRYARNDDGSLMLDDDNLPQQGDFGVLGQGVAPTTIGLTNTIRYKSVALSFLLDSKQGGDLYSGTNRAAYGNGLHQATLEGRENGTLTLPDGQTQSYEPADIQDYYSRVTSITEQFVYDASFIKLRQFTLTYILPNSIIENSPFAGVSVSLVGRNLWIISSSIDNIDPESTYSNGNAQGLEWLGVPQTRSFGFNLNLKF